MKYAENAFEYKKCCSADIEDICEIQEAAFRNLDNPDLLRRNSRETLLACLNSPHYTIGAWHNEKLIAFAILYEGGHTSENIGKDMNLPHEMLELTSNIKLVIVLPEYRGNGLQKKLMKRLEAEAVKRGKKLLCATVSPDNVFSQRNFESEGYKFHSCKIKYGGLKRNIFFKEI